MASVVLVEEYCWPWRQRVKRLVDGSRVVKASLLEILEVITCCGCDSREPARADGHNRLELSWIPDHSHAFGSIEEGEN